jgi:serine/threonine protein kinase
MQELIGKQLGPYHIELKIGQGGMAAVFKAYHTSLGRYVAIKVLSPSLVVNDPDFARRFRREAKLIAQLDHPHILPVHDYGMEQGYSYLVMRYVEEGQTLERVMRQALTQARAVELISQIGQALVYAHQQGVIHRDLKPSNVLMDGNWPLLSDFGLAKADWASTRLTDSWKSIGTPAYMSPEQFRGPQVDQRTDIYALGVILYQMLTGCIPHAADNPWAIGIQRATQLPTPPRQLNATISEDMEQVILRALESKPENRYASAAEFVAALQRTGAEAPSEDESTIVISPPAAASEPLAISKNKSVKEFLRASWHVPIWLVVFIVSFVAVSSFVWVRGSFLPPTPQPEPTQAALSITQAPISSPTATFTPTSTQTLTKTFKPLTTTSLTTATPTPTPAATEESFALLNALGLDIPSHGSTSFERARPDPLAEDQGRDRSGSGDTGNGMSITPTATSTLTPTLTAAIQVALPTATPTPTSTPSTAAFILLHPLDLGVPTYGPTLFEWAWPDPLAEDQGFEVRVWREGEPPLGAHDAVADNQAGLVESLGQGKYRLAINIKDAAGIEGSGEYLWSVALIQINPEYADLGLQAPPAYLRFEVDDGGNTIPDLFRNE